MTIYRVVIALDLLRVPKMHISAQAALMVCTAHLDGINMAELLP